MNTEDVMKNIHRIAKVMRRGHHGGHGHGRCHGHDHGRGGGQGLHHGQGRLLLELEKMDGVSQGELAEAMGIRSPSLTELVDKMEEAGLVERARKASDARISELHLTAKGKKAVEEAKKHHAEMHEKVFAHLSPEECSQLAVLLGKFAQGMEEAHLAHEGDEMNGGRGRYGEHGRDRDQDHDGGHGRGRGCGCGHDHARGRGRGPRHGDSRP